MIDVEIRSKLDPPWPHLTPLRLGAVPNAVGSPDAIVTIARDGTPLVRIDLYARHEEECLAFESALWWPPFVAIGFGQRVYLVRPIEKETKTFDLGSYFGHFYSAENQLLVASCERLFCIDRDAELLWRSNVLGVDGVLVSDVTDGVITGDGEWDPPGGWRTFSIRLDSGAFC